jgi:uncharacterized protein (TIGR02145 family)
MKKAITIMGAILVASVILTSCGGSNNSPVKIGEQEWMGGNLNVTTFKDGSQIPEAKTDAEWRKAGEEQKPAWCYYKSDVEDAEEIGKIYNWYAVNDKRGLAPAGWHVATDEDWEKLIEFAGDDEAAIKLKSKKGWRSKGVYAFQDVNSNATNETGFGALPGGGRGPQYALGESAGWWWSASEVDDENAYYFHMKPNEEGLKDEEDAKKGNEVEKLEYEKWAGMRVRCVKD